MKAAKLATSARAKRNTGELRRFMTSYFAEDSLHTILARSLNHALSKIKERAPTGDS